MGKVIVFLDKITNLIDSDGLGKSDPYVKFHLEQDNMMFDKNYGKQESSHQKNTCNPTFEETFEFDGVPTLKNLTLGIKIMDDDFGKDDAIGQAKVDLEKVNLTAEPQEITRVVDHKKGGSWFSKKAKIVLKVSYVE